MFYYQYYFFYPITVFIRLKISEANDKAYIFQFQSNNCVY